MTKRCLTTCAALAKAAVRRGLVADQLDEADIVGAALPDFRRARFGRLGGGDDRGQRFVVDLDQFGGVGCLRGGFRDHEGNRIADPAHAVFGQHRVGRLEHRRAVAEFEPAVRGQFAQPRLLPVGRGDDGKHAGRGFGGVGLERQDFRVSMRRTQHDAERHAGIDHVVDIAAAALNESRILETRHALTDCKFTHGNNYPSIAGITGR